MHKKIFFIMFVVLWSIFISVDTVYAQSDSAGGLPGSFKRLGETVGKRLEKADKSVGPSAGQQSPARRQVSDSRQLKGNSPNGLKLDATGPFPTIDQIIDKYVQALGGKDLIMKFTSRVTKGTADMPGVFRRASLETYAKAPNKSVTIINAPGFGAIKQGYNGNVGWDQTAQTGLRNLTGVDLAEMQRDSDFYGPVRLKVKYPKIAMLGRMKLGFREVFVIEAKPIVGDAEKLFFDTETGLLLRWDVMRATAQGRAPAEVYFYDWREVDGIKISFGITQSFPGFAINLTLTEAKHNVPVDDAVFNKPATP